MTNTDKRKNKLKKVKIVEWNIADKCNYQCSYCSSGVIKEGTHTPINDYKIFIDKLDKALKGNWLIHLGGYGEPFVSPNFMDIVKELAKRNYYIGIITNFSSPVQKIFDFHNIVGENLLYFNASLHLEMADLDKFLRRAIKVKKRIPFLVVSLVAQRKRLSQIIEASGKIKKEGIKCVVQLEKGISGFSNYIKEELDKLEKEIGYIYGLKGNNNFYGKKCSVGRAYFVLDNDGHAYSCYSYKNAHKGSAEKKNGYLGNILEDNFGLNKKDITCRLKFCSCSTPWRAKNWER